MNVDDVVVGRSYMVEFNDGLWPDHRPVWIHEVWKVLDVLYINEVEEDKYPLESFPQGYRCRCELQRTGTGFGLAVGAVMDLDPGAFLWPITELV